MFRRALLVLLGFVLVVGVAPATAAPPVAPAGTPGQLMPHGRVAPTAAAPDPADLGDCELLDQQTPGITHCRPNNPPDSSCTGYTSQTTAPSTIKVLVRTGDSTTEIRTIPFVTYLQNVLPNEWLASWDGDALKAGAVAVKSYAWYWATHYGGYVGTAPTSSTCFDVTDDQDFQVYKAGTAVARTNQKIAEIGTVAARRNGAIVQTFYRDFLSKETEACGTGRNGTTMSQFGTQNCNEANTGYKYNVILKIYYGQSLELSSTAQLRAQHDFRFAARSTAVTFDAGKWAVNDGYPTTFGLGRAGDQPVITTGGDGFSTIGVYRPANATFYLGSATGSVARTQRFGTIGDKPVAAQYQGLSTATQLAVFRPSTGFWYFNGTGSSVASSVAFGRNGDIPVPGRWTSAATDSIAVFRPSTGSWYIRGGATVPFGRSGDVPAPADYTGDGITDVAVYRPSTHTFYVRGSGTVPLGAAGDVPVTGDFTGDSRADYVVYRPSTNRWYVRGVTAFTFGSGVPVGAAPYRD